eukprot:TRINITY_DN34657_c0_g1_i1.p1 TRINITY_DN34657_c0_g1~~TRINITY_DN34657_c0_g1_i1.p1  ORF type:complete len:318 (-),score=66.86 TRINITY_DN34657_c0_g1_i1:53-910(-)
MASLVAKKRQNLKEEVHRLRAEEDATTEKWSGLRITDRIVRQEKWDTCMRGKSLIQLSGLSAVSQPGRDKVVIGVLYAAPSLPKQSPKGEMYGEWVLTDLHKKCPSEATLILVGRAMDHWVHQDGLGKPQATVGSIIGILNPQATGKSSAIRVSFETQVMKLGTCPSLAFCSAIGGILPCKKPYNSEAMNYCAHHSSQSHGERQAEVDGRLPRQKRQISTSAAQRAPTKMKVDVAPVTTSCFRQLIIPDKTNKENSQIRTGEKNASNSSSGDAKKCLLSQSGLGI